MKTTVYIIFIALLITSTTNTYGQEDKKSIQTIEFKVSGVCNMCKARIENAALIKGVKFAEWNKETQTITLVFKTAKTTEDKIHQAIANVGHDTEKIKAPDDAYSELPACCAYRNDIKAH